MILRTREQQEHDGGFLPPADFLRFYAEMEKLMGAVAHFQEQTSGMNEVAIVVRGTDVTRP